MCPRIVSTDLGRLHCKTWKVLSITCGHAAARLSSLTRRDGVPSPLPPTELSRRGPALEAHGGELDQIRPFWQVSDEPEQSQYHEKNDEQHQAVPRSGLYLRAINPVKFHRRVPQPFQPLHQGAHPRVPSSRPRPTGRLGPYRGVKCRASAAAWWSITRRMFAFIVYTLITAVSSSRPFSP
jgi:hypothetical protein